MDGRTTNRVTWSEPFAGRSNVPAWKEYMDKRPIIVGAMAVGVLAAAGGIAAWMILTRPDPTRRPPERNVPVVLGPKIQPLRNHRVELIGSGSARPKVRLKIIPQVSGVVVEKSESFLSGRSVRRGQLLCQIDKTDYELARDAAKGRVELLDRQIQRLDQQQANLAEMEKIEQGLIRLSEKQLSNAKQLLSRGAGAENDVDTAEQGLLLRRAVRQGILNQQALIEPQRNELLAQKRIAEVEHSRAKTDYDRTTLTSPVNGRSLGCNIEVGEHVQAGSVCGELYGTDVMEVPIAIPSGDLQWIDTELLKACEGGEGKNPSKVIAARLERKDHGTGRRVQWPGRVERLEAGVEAATRMARLVVVVRNDKLPPGTPPLDINMFCTATIFGKELPEAFLIPRSAILPNGGVYVVEDGKLAIRQVRVARFSDTHALILPGNGIDTGDRVVIGPVPKPVLGMSVQAIDEPSTRPTTGAAPKLTEP